MTNQDGVTWRFESHDRYDRIQQLTDSLSGALQSAKRNGVPLIGIDIWSCGDKDIEAIDDKLPTTLKSIKISNSYSQDKNDCLTPKGIKRIVALINRSPDLEELSLGIYSASKENIKALAEALTQCPKLKSLKLRLGKSTAPEGMHAINRALGTLSNLEALDLTDMPIDGHSAKEFNHALEQMPSLRSLDLMGKCINDSVLEELSPFFARKQLTNLGLLSVDIGSQGIKALVPALKDSSIENVALTRDYDAPCRIGEEEGLVLADALAGNKTIKRFVLCRTEIGDKAAAALSNAFLKDNKTIERIALDENKMGDEGIKTIAESLKGNPSLEFINLEHNRIGVKAAQALGALLNHNPTIDHVQLGYCGIGDDEARAFAENVGFNNRLQQLYVTSGCKISGDGYQALLAPFAESMNFSWCGGQGRSALHVHAHKNSERATDLVKRMHRDPGSLTRAELNEIRARRFVISSHARYPWLRVSEPVFPTPESVEAFVDTRLPDAPETSGQKRWASSATSARGARGEGSEWTVG